jgi:hypothetical protein
MFVRKVSVFLAAALVSLPMAANAEETTPEPEIEWGIEAPAMIVQAPKHAWGTRRILRYLDEQLPSFTVYFGKCYTMPDVPCMKVYVAEYGVTGWLGMFSFMDTANTVRRIQYNETYIKTTGKLYSQARADISCHEVLHAFGMPHHEGDGCLPDRQPYPSASEMSVLQAFYQ